MELTGDVRLPARREAVWQALSDPEVLRACIPGCTALEKTSDTEFEAEVEARVGPVKAAFTGAVALEDLNPPSSWTLRGEGDAGAAGFAEGTARVTLAEEGGGTRLTYAVEATIGGKLAQVGGRFVDGVAAKMAEQFFATFSEQLAGGAAMPEADEGGGLPPVVWATTLIVVVGLLLFWFGW